MPTALCWNARCCHDDLQNEPIHIRVGPDWHAPGVPFLHRHMNSALRPVIVAELDAGVFIFGAVIADESTYPNSTSNSYQEYFHVT